MSPIAPRHTAEGARADQSNVNLGRYDTILMGNFFAYPEFKQKFGDYYEGVGEWQVNGPWQVGLSMGSTVGGIFGES